MNKRSDSVENNLVITCFTNLLLSKAEYITNGVPAQVLEKKLLEALGEHSDEMDFEGAQNEVKKMISKEISDETLLQFPSGNYFNGPKKSSELDKTNVIDREMSPLLPSSDEDDFEEGDKSKQDEDYFPKNYSGVFKKCEGRVSSRMKKSRFDSDEYVYPSIFKNLNKRSSSQVLSPPEKKKKRGRKPKKKCPIEPSATHASCKQCAAKAPTSSVEISSKDGLAGWLCATCQENPTDKSQCNSCGEMESKVNGILIACDVCKKKYHRSCHIPVITTKHIKMWKCAGCVPKDSTTKSAVKLAQDIVDDDASSIEKFSPSALCSGCSGLFANSVDRLNCIACSKSYHSACCRVRDIANISRLGGRKHRWRCDFCKSDKGVKGENDVRSTKAWWTSRLREIVVQADQPPLGPIPDPSVPDVSRWDSTKVKTYFEQYFLDKEIAKLFATHDIDGSALKIMRRNDVISLFDDAGYNVGIALDVLQHVKRLQLRVNDRRYIWADIF